MKFALTRQQMFSLVGYRRPTIQRIQLGADADGRLTAIAHDAIEQTSKIKEFAEQTAVVHPGDVRRAQPAHHPPAGGPGRPAPTIMRAPGECPGMFALESAMDEMAIACGLDPVELRIRNEPDVDPESGLPFSSRNLVACLREGARRFGWAQRDPTPRPGATRGWLVGTGVASSTYPAYPLPGLGRNVRVSPEGATRCAIGAADIGTGTWTALTQIAADALGVAVDDVELRIGDTALPPASIAGGSSGIPCWGSSIVAGRPTSCAPAWNPSTAGPCRPRGCEVTADHAGRSRRRRGTRCTRFGAQFAEVRVNEDTGEVRVPRLLGVFAAGGSSTRGPPARS